jgi:hypothetical protein
LIFLLCLVSSSIMAQKINLDTLDIDQLNLYKHKAVTMRNAGMIFTLGGVGVVVTGLIIGSIISNSDPESSYDELSGTVVIMIAGMVGIPTTIYGIPFWAIGGSRKAKAELALQKINIIASKNSMAVGLGVTLRF